jgi:hypothetical protein
MGMSRRLVGEATGIGKTEVGEYVRRAAVVGLSWPIPDEIDDAELERRLFPPPDAASSTSRTEPNWSHNHAELKRRGVTLALLWQEYRAEHAQGNAYSWFCERYSDWRSSFMASRASTACAVARSPIAAAAAAALSGVRPVTQTCAPARRNSIAAARPMPEVPPMITAFCPSKHTVLHAQGNIAPGVCLGNI